MEFMKKIGELTQKVGETATETYKTVADKSGKFIEETKAKMTISDKEEEIVKSHETMGKAVYEAYLSGEDVGKVFTKECKKIDKLKEEIEDMNKKVLYNKNLRKCSNCSYVISLDSVFCYNCGSKQKPIRLKEEKEVVETKKEVPREKVCPQCGLISDFDVKFCTKCGYKF
ncbi:MAG: zinc ribbon domain-containing protein [Clostridia bacterium]|nr:zinc ribbon domain-containing protein [Clostridia bacterium]